VQAQQKSATGKKDSTFVPPVVKKQKPVNNDSMYAVPGGLRLGLDLSRFVITAFQPYRKEIAVVADGRINANMYATGELGYSNTSHSDSNYTYKGNGIYTTLGIDYNFLKRQDPKERNILYAGVRYGFAHLSYSAPSYTISSGYWGEKTMGSFPQTDINTHWVEIVLGMKVEVMKNFFLGWNIREKLMISNVQKSDFPPIVIPGYGNASKKSSFDVQYTVSYCLPLWKVKVPFPKPAVSGRAKKEDDKDKKKKK
jgi:hypothetical protein